MRISHATTMPQASLQRYVAFLRAINITGKFIKMPDLRELFSSWGLANVQTYIQTGNVIFDAEPNQAQALATALSGQLAVSFGFAITTFVRTMEDFQRLAQTQLWMAERTEGATVYVGFLAGQPTEAQLARLAKLNTPIDECSVRGRELLWIARRHLGKSTLSGARIERALGQETTIRNWNVIEQMAALFLEGQ